MTYCQNKKSHLYHSASQIQRPLDVTFVTKEEVISNLTTVHVK